MVITVITASCDHVHAPNPLLPYRVTYNCDLQRFQKMLGYYGSDNRFGENEAIRPIDIKAASNRSMLLSTEIRNSIAPGDSVNIVFAIVAGKKAGSDIPSLDTDEQKENF